MRLVIAAFAVVVELRDGVVGERRIEDVWIFDVFRGPQIGEGRRNLAFRLRFAAADHTLAEDELASLRERCIRAVLSAVPAELRA